MEYEKGPFAFFEGTRSEYRKVARTSDTIDDFTVAAIEPAAVRLVGGTNTIVMPVNMEMRREDGGPWHLATRAETLVASSDRSDRSRSDRNGRGRNSDSRNPIAQYQPESQSTNQAPDIITAVQEILQGEPPPELPPPPPDVIVNGGADSNEDPVLRALRLRRERETKP